MRHAHLAAIECDLEIREQQGMRLLGPRTERRHKQRCREKGVIWQLDAARLLLIVRANHPQPAIVQGCLIAQIQAELANAIVRVVFHIIHRYSSFRIVASRKEQV
jgi:hypothetical protein